MKQKIIWIILFGLLAFSCKKNSDEPQKDDIVYKNINPDKEIQTVSFYTLQDHGICTANIPAPTDSIVNYDLDIDNNQVADFRIKVAHTKYLDYCGHCDVFTYNISIEGLSVDNTVANSASPNMIAKFFNASDVVDKNNEWVSLATMVLLEGCALPFQTDFTDGYIGVKIKNSYGYIQLERMSNNGIRILEHGLNKTANNAIKCGQTK